MYRFVIVEPSDQVYNLSVAGTFRQGVQTKAHSCFLKVFLYHLGIAYRGRVITDPHYSDSRDKAIFLLEGLHVSRDFLLDFFGYCPTI